MSNSIFRLFVVNLLAVGFIFFKPSELSGQSGTIKIQSKGKSYIGKQLAYDGRDMVLLRRDGRISIVPVRNSSAVKRVSNGFKPYNSEVIRQKLQKEFGSKYQVSKTQNFVVVHPHGDYQKWAMPFEILYQRFRNYFSSRGFSLTNPQFPMVAIVLRTRNEFDKFLRTYHTYSANTLGYYSQKSNRIITYDPTSGRGANKDWAFEDTLIHEAVHQTSFNVGLHRRYGFTPVWVLEGLACMFEAKGVYNSMYFSTERARINKNRLLMLKHFYAQKKAQGKLVKMVAKDDYFDRDPSFAYAYAWGLTFFLAEKYPSQLFEYLKADGARAEFREFKAKDRIRAFKNAFGGDLKGLEKRMEKYIMSLKV